MCKQLRIFVLLLIQTKKMKHTQIFREQDVTDLIGSIVFDRGCNRVLRVTGAHPNTGFVQFNNPDITWVGFDSLKDYMIVTDITGLSARKAIQKIGQYPKRLKEHQMKELIQNATA